MAAVFLKVIGVFGISFTSRNLSNSERI
jgi:hypothetical protein